MTQIRYPYIPEGKTIFYVGANNPYMALAKDFAQRNSLDETMPGAAVIVKDGIVLGMGANGSDHHKKYACARVTKDCKSGEDYELCEGCHPKNHSEPKAIQDAIMKWGNIREADIYLWGHWWCCKPCWEAITQAGITRVFLLKNSEALFNKEHPNNIVGRQFQE